MKKLLLLIIVVFSNIFCGSSNCENTEVRKLFNKQIGVLDESTNITLVVTGDAMLAVFFMEELTKIKSSVQYGDVSVYDSKAAYKRDKSNWKKWYKENECSLDIESLKILFEKIKGNNTWLKSKE